MQPNAALMSANEFLRHPEYNEKKYSAALDLLFQVLEVVDLKESVIKQQELEIENLYRKLEKSELLI